MPVGALILFRNLRRRFRATSSATSRNENERFIAHREAPDDAILENANNEGGQHGPENGIFGHLAKNGKY